MNWVDWIIVAILTISSLISLLRGFFKEAFSLVIWMLALVLSNLFGHQGELLLTNIIATPLLRTMASFVGIFVAVLLCGALINYLVNLWMKETALSLPNRLLGFCFGFARGLFVVMILLIYMPSFSSEKKDSWYQHSLLIPSLSPYQATVKNTTEELTRWVSLLMVKVKGMKN